MENQENLILIDWFTCVFKHIDFHGVIDLLGLTGASFEKSDRGLRGYPERLMFNGINILYGGSVEMGVCLDMSGQGCRCFESYTRYHWTDLLRYCLGAADDGDAHITRFDLAFDDHTGILDMQRILDDTDDGNYTSKSRWWMVEYGSEGSCVYFGSPKSNHRIRIYDKAAERGYTDDTHWIRVEMQMRDTNASECIRKCLDTLDVGAVFCGVLHNYLVFRNGSDDSNKSRWLITDYWEELLNGVARISLWVSPGTEYNVFKMENWLVDQCGAAIRCYNDLFGLDELLNKIKVRNVRTSPKYERLKQEAEHLRRRAKQ